MQSDDPAFLMVGTEVSAKFKGAFCEAKIKRFSKSVKCKVLSKEAPFTSVFVDHSQIQGILEVNQIVDVTVGKESFKAVIQHIKDNSTYTVVFNDGDERQLRRTQLCIKGAKHFDDSANLDTMPLYNPETFSSPVVPEVSKGNRYKAKSGDDDAQGAVKMVDNAKGNGKRRQQRLSEEEDLLIKKPRNDEKLKKCIFEPGNVVAVYEEVSKKSCWIPAVVVSTKAFTTFAKGGVTLGKNEVPLRGFKDAKYFSTLGGCLTFLRQASLKNLDSAHKSAFERANGFAEKGTFPMNWERNQIYGEEVLSSKARRESSASAIDSKKEQVEEKKKEKPKSRNVVVQSSSSESSEEDEDYGEERDQFTAQLYKFHEERGTPINRAPILGGKDIDMFRLYNLVQEYGGKKRVTENNMWKKIMCKLHLEGCPGANPRKVQNAYSRYLDHFSIFYKNLGVSNWLASSTSTRSVRQIRLTDRDAEQFRRKRLAEKKKEKEKKKREQKRETKDDDYVIREKDGKKARAKVGRDDKKERSQALLKKEKLKEKVKKEEKDIKRETESDVSSLSDAKPDAVEDDKDVGLKQGGTDYRSGGRNDTESSAVEVEKYPSRKRKSNRSDPSKSDSMNNNKGEANENVKKRGKHVSSMKKLGRKKICSESDATEEYSDATKLISPSIASSTPSTSAAADRLASASASEDEGAQSSVRKSGKRKGSFRENSAVSTTSCSSDHTADFAATTKSSSDNSKPKKKRKERDGVKRVHATLFTQFYQGQNVTAHHLSQWYDARIQGFDQPSFEELTNILVEYENRLKKESENTVKNEVERTSNMQKESACLWLYNRLEVLQKQVRCFVHYLGWNTRYDSWALLADIEVADKDQLESENQFRALVPDKISAATLNRALIWCSNAVGTDVTLDGLNDPKLEESDENRSSPISQMEVSSSETVDIGVAGSTVNAAEKCLHKSFAGALRVKKPLGACDSPSVNTEIGSSNDESTSSIVVTSGVDSSTNFEVSVTGPLEKSAMLSASENQSLSYTPKLPEKVDAVVNHSLHCASVSGVSNKSPEEVNIPEKVGALVRSGQDVDVKVDDFEQSTTDADAKCSKLDTAKANYFQRKSRIGQGKVFIENAIQCEVSLSRSSGSFEGAFDLFCEDAQETKICLPVMQYESVLLTTRVPKAKKLESCESSLKDEDTMAVPIAEEVKDIQSESLEVTAQELVETAVLSPSTVLVKQETCNSLTVTNEFEQFATESNDTTDEDCVSPKDSFHALKLRMLQKIESNIVSIDVEKELGLGPIDEKLAGDALIFSLQTRIQEIKDLYHFVRGEQCHLDRRWRKTSEKRRQREKEQRKKDEMICHNSE